MPTGRGAAPARRPGSPRCRRQARDQLRDGVRARVADALQRRDEVGSSRSAPRRRRSAAHLVALQDPGEDQVQEALRLGRVQPAPGEVDRRVDELRPRHAAEAAMCLLEAGDEPRPRPTLADVVALGRVAEVDGDVLELAQGVGAAKKQSSSVTSPSTQARRKPPPAGPVRGSSATAAANAAAMQASTALPPSSSTRAPASAVTASGGDRSLHELRAKMLYGCR